MKFTVVAVLSALAATVVAGPAPFAEAEAEAAPFAEAEAAPIAEAEAAPLAEAAADAENASTARATFYGAGGASFRQSFKADGKGHPITNRLSVSKIHLTGANVCNFLGVDGQVTNVKRGKTVAVGPPQAQKRVVCR